MTATHQPHRRSDLKRGKFAVSVDPERVKRIDELVKDGVFRSRSHGFDEALRRLLKDHEREESKSDE